MQKYLRNILTTDEFEDDKREVERVIAIRELYEWLYRSIRELYSTSTASRLCIGRFGYYSRKG